LRPEGFFIRINMFNIHLSCHVGIHAPLSTLLPLDVLSPPVCRSMQGFELEIPESFFFLMPPHVYTNFHGPPPGFGGSVTDF